MAQYASLLKEIPSALISWYNTHQRMLPWREDVSAYHTWLSEIILQQTRVEQGLPYYMRFIEHYPTVEDLARAPEDNVLKLWQGLGYYSRARNLHKAAKLITQTYGGKFPNNYAEILKLPGVGPYTAAAISSIAFGEEQAVVDGNVIRVITRLLGIETPVDESTTQKEIKGIADQLIHGQDPSCFNQAMMEFGALQCTPKKPNCMYCPLQSSCTAFANGTIDRIPWKRKKVKRRSRFLHFLISTNPEKLLIEQRGDTDIWRGLYQFPLIETETDLELPVETIDEKTGWNCKIIRVNMTAKHVLSHQDLFARFYHLDFKVPKNTTYRLISSTELHTFALPRLIDRYLENYDPSSGEKRL